MEEVKNNKGTGFAIGALVTGIISFLLAVIPCIGLLAILPAIIAIVLGVVGISRAKGNSGMIIGGLVIGIIALMISLSQIFLVSKVARHSDRWGSDFEKAFREIKTDIRGDFNDKDVTIRINTKGDTIEIKGQSSRKDLEKKLDELESGTDSSTSAKKTK